MTKQFNVYRNTSTNTRNLLPYYVVVQNDHYDDLSTRIIMPLMRHHKIPRWYSHIAPQVNIEFDTLNIYAPMISHIDKSQIKPKDFICHLNTARRDIVATIDALFTNN